MESDEVRLTPVGKVLSRLRWRAWLLRIQAYCGMLLIIIIAVSLIYFLTSRSFPDSEIETEVQKYSRHVFPQKLFEERHAALIEKIDGLIDAAQHQWHDGSLEDKLRKQALNVRMNTAIDDLRQIKIDISNRISKDRENLLLEIRQLKDERDLAARKKAENSYSIRVFAEAGFRLGAIALTFYLISILANVSKYLLRVADHLNSVADSVEMLDVANLPLDKGIQSLTPHPIDFHVENGPSLASIKELGDVLAKIKG